MEKSAKLDHHKNSMLSLKKALKGLSQKSKKKLKAKFEKKAESDKLDNDRDIDSLFYYRFL